MSKKGQQDKKSVAANRSFIVLHREDSFFEFGLFNLEFLLRLGRYNKETDQHDYANALTTTINYEDASTLHYMVKYLADSWDESVLHFSLQCDDGTTLTLDRRVDSEDKVNVYLIIDKNDQKFSFQFPTRAFQREDRGECMTTIFQAGVASLCGALEGFINYIAICKDLIKSGDLD